MIASLDKALKGGDKSLVGNKGYRKFLRPGGKQFTVDQDKIKEEARYDGKWVLTTNTDLPTAEVALKYKQLWMVEDVFRSMKSILDTRPVFHRRDETIRGHVFCSFLALLLRKELEDRLSTKQWKLEWADIIRISTTWWRWRFPSTAKATRFVVKPPAGPAKFFRRALSPSLLLCVHANPGSEPCDNAPRPIVRRVTTFLLNLQTTPNEQLQTFRC